jgi:hypothetical protein
VNLNLDSIPNLRTIVVNTKPTSITNLNSFSMLLETQLSLARSAVRIADMTSAMNTVITNTRSASITVSEIFVQVSSHTSISGYDVRNTAGTYLYTNTMNLVKLATVNLMTLATNISIIDLSTFINTNYERLFEAKPVDPSPTSVILPSSTRTYTGYNYSETIDFTYTRMTLDEAINKGKPLARALAIARANTLTAEANIKAKEVEVAAIAMFQGMPFVWQVVRIAADNAKKAATEAIAAAATAATEVAKAVEAFTPSMAITLSAGSLSSAIAAGVAATALAKTATATAKLKSAAAVAAAETAHKEWKAREELLAASGPVAASAVDPRRQKADALRTSASFAESVISRLASVVESIASMPADIETLATDFEITDGNTFILVNSNFNSMSTERVGPTTRH